MNKSDGPGFLNRRIPLWAAMLAVFIAIMASGSFAFSLAFALFHQRVIAVPPEKPQK